MGDMGDIFREFKAEKKRRRSERLSNMPNIDDTFKENEIIFEIKNNGQHYIVKKRGVTTDYWPSTGYWKCRNTNKRGRNILPLVRHLNKLEVKTNDRRLF